MCPLKVDVAPYGFIGSFPGIAIESKDAHTNRAGWSWKASRITTALGQKVRADVIRVFFPELHV